MKTIKTKLFLLSTVFMIALVLCGILFNILFLERYYIYKHRDIFSNINKEVTQEYINNRGNIQGFINEINHRQGIRCIITDRNLNIEYKTFSSRLKSDAMILPKEIKQLVIENKMKLSKGELYTVIKREEGQTSKLILLSQTNTQEIIILTKSMEGIRESAIIANEFYGLAGLVIIIFGGIFIMFLSKKITGPVVEMGIVAEAISNLEFNKRVRINSQDEIGRLGESINRMSENLSTSMNALRMDVERRKQLTRNISHELKTPISVIKGYAEGLKYGVVDDKDGMEKYCKVIVEECDQMDSMVRALLSLSMFESEMFKLNITRFELGQLAENIADRFACSFTERAIQFELVCQERLAIEADYELLERVLNNFITNAINHVDERKVIKLTIERKQNATIISVFNTGEHIPSTDLENIWDVFYKVDKARSRKYGGHGLGLAIVRLIIQLHGGVTGVENVEEGVRFFVELR